MKGQLKGRGAPEGRDRTRIGPIPATSCHVFLKTVTYLYDMGGPCQSLGFGRRLREQTCERELGVDRFVPFDRCCVVRIRGRRC